ncbi:hypothetical protein ACLOJK_029537, partial [Asimina triloba]
YTITHGPPEHRNLVLNHLPKELPWSTPSERHSSRPHGPPSSTAPATSTNHRRQPRSAAPDRSSTTHSESEIPDPSSSQLRNPSDRRSAAKIRSGPKNGSPHLVQDPVDFINADHLRAV